MREGGFSRSANAVKKLERSQPVQFAGGPLATRESKATPIQTAESGTANGAIKGNETLTTA